MSACPSSTQSLTPEGEEVSWSPPGDPHSDGRVPCQFHMDLGWCPVKAVDGRPLARGSTKRVEHVPQRSTLGPLEDPCRRQRPQGGGDGNPVSQNHGLQTPSYKGECWPSPQYPCHQIKVGYSKDQYLQWWCHTRKNRGILQAVVPWGTTCQGSLPRIGGPGKYC